jgi:hypothetical protein
MPQNPLKPGDQGMILSIFIKRLFANPHELHVAPRLLFRTGLFLGIAAALSFPFSTHAQTVFGGSTIQPLGTPARDLTEGDFNNDGKPDLALLVDSTPSKLVSEVRGVVSLFLNQGDGTFELGSQQDSRIDPTALIAADFNTDGKLDVFLLDRTHNQAEVKFGDGKGTFGYEPTGLPVWPTGESPASPVTGDFNHDGFADVAFADYGIFVLGGSLEDHTHGSFGDFVEVWYGDGKGDFPNIRIYDLSSTPRSESTNPHMLVQADLNRDGLADFVTANGYTDASLQYTSGSVGIIQSLSVPTREAYAVGTLPSDALKTLAAGDFNGDGRTDLAAVAIRYAGFDAIGVLKTWLSTPDRGLVAQPDLPESFLSPFGDSFAYTTVLRAAPLSGTGRDDLVAIGLAGLQVFRSNADGTFREPEFQRSNNAVPNMVLEDLNGDGHRDAAYFQWSANSYPNNDLVVVWGEPDRATLLAPPTWNPSPADARTSINLLQPKAVDFNHDGYSDMATVEYTSTGQGQTSAYLRIYLGNREGTLKPVFSLGPFGFGDFRPSGVVVGDFNGDRVPDLLELGSTAGNGFMALLLGNGDGTFTKDRELPFPKDRAYFRVGDFDGDGKSDVIAALDDAHEVDLYASNHFFAMTPIRLPEYIENLFVEDFNGDGKSDILLLSTYGSAARIILGNAPDKLDDSTIQFVAPALHTIEASLVADLTGDGKPDLLGVTELAGQKRYGVLPNNGDGTFGAVIDTGIDFQSDEDRGPVAEDFNRDGITYVPLLETVQALGGTVTWDNTNKVATATIAQWVATVSMAAEEADVSGTHVTFNGPTLVENDRMWVPVRFFEKAFGYRLDLNGDTLNIVNTNA